SEQANANQKSSFGNSMLGLGEGLLNNAATVGAAFAGKPPCWIAAASFGSWDAPEVNLVRNLIFNKWNHGIRSLIAKFYLVFGERIAERVKGSRLLQWAFRGIFKTLIRIGY
ncbi:MAG: hypothetical protein ACREQ5_12640, partial [Candidatus Dormibacteria bacterium]